MKMKKTKKKMMMMIIIRCLILFVYPIAVVCQSNNNDAALVPLIAPTIYASLSNFSTVFEKDIEDHLGFCIKDAKADLNGAFNFSSNLGFLTECIRRQEDFTQRICTAAEMKLYFGSFFSSGSSDNNLNLNANCNLSSWNPGCEPGWACSVPVDEKVDLQNSKDIPTRHNNCKTCCEGFFCPRGLTCMIPCPLGAHCPMATLNSGTGLCDPYSYQLPPGQPNHTCGGADKWSDIRSSRELFCSAGSYCPSTTEKIPCRDGHYCRTGSISEKKCFKLTSCNAYSANQNIHAYGIMLLAALGTLLLIIYNCSDQVITTRERRHAKSRQAAARSARETAQARERWKSAKDAAKKHAFGLQAQLSRTFSRKQSHKKPEPAIVLGHARPQQDDTLLIPLPPGGSRVSQQPSTTSKTKKNEPSNLTRVMYALEDDLDSTEGFSQEHADNSKVKKIPKGKEIHTHSQIFKYAYGQLEKEKALQQENKELTFSRVIAMATEKDIKTRPMIEVSFKDLTLTLKGKNKHLLRCVTGKIMPGRVSAVMGPSGAGKTTFLNALAGKATGCTITGLVLINGKNEPIHSYKKIIGFVPQDDIVHGNLTVEENLWFNARCRLSSTMSKPDKVLVIERVIESLGLQAVRDSLVGTVEKRGISGGQRKRVNVGLEMVMEPSLLILDEPTSGLDSSSSRLLLKALRWEALEGVNICMVVHQPSYALFKMFDDLILLAKGGLTVYHGSVKKIEEYFAGLGINVPDRVNPPDHFIDILEGIAKPSTNTNVTASELPIRWMLHNGYQIPSDMQQNAAAIASSSRDSNPRAIGGAEEQSFAGELWQDVRSNVELKTHYIQHNFLKSTDLSNRRTPGIFQQYKYFLGRVGKQRMREAKVQVVDYLILLLAGACLGTVAKVSDETFGVQGYTYTIIAVSLLCKISALRSFSLDKLIYWRESSSGMSSLAYFLAKDTIDHFNTVIKPLVYLSMFYFVNNPRSSFTDNYVILLCLVYCVTGIAYAFAILLEPGAAQLWSVLLPVVATLIATQRDGELVKAIAYACYPKWALEAFIISNASRYSGVWLITRCGFLLKSGYDVNDWGLCLSVLMLFGLVSRVIAFVSMVTFKRK